MAMDAEACGMYCFGSIIESGFAKRSHWKSVPFWSQVFVLLGLSALLGNLLVAGDNATCPYHSQRSRQR